MMPARHIVCSWHARRPLCAPQRLAMRIAWASDGLEHNILPSGMDATAVP